MTATLEQIQSDGRRLVEIAQTGEDVMIISHGIVVAKLTGVAPSPAPNVDIKDWLAKLAILRESLSTGKIGTTSEEILEDLREDRV